MKRLNTNDLQKLLAETVKMFSVAQIKYMLIGAVAVDVWGRPRTTLDLDFAVSADKNELEILKQTAVKSGYKIDRKWEKHNPMAKDFQTRLSKCGISVDILIPRDEHDIQALSNRKKKRLDNLSFFVVTPDDLILQKLKVGRPKDFEDALSVLIRSGKFVDLKYLRKWALKLGITEELDYILKS